MAAVAAEDLKRQERRPRVDPEPTSRHQTDQSLFGSSPFSGRNLSVRKPADRSYAAQAGVGEFSSSARTRAGA